jgi:hypothetical protein
MRRFYPIYETKYYNQPQDSKCLDVPDDILKVFSVVTENGSSTIDPDNYNLACGKDYNIQPYDRIIISSNVGDTFNYSGTPEKSTAVTALFGYHEDYDNAWVALDTIQDVSITADDITFTVSDVDGEDEDGLPNRFKIQQLLRFGEDGEVPAEMVYVKGLNYQTNQITVNRGMNGTTAIEQLQDTVVYVYRPMQQIVEAMELLATYSYRRRYSVGSNEDRDIASPTGIVLLSSKLPGEVKDILEAYKKWPKHYGVNTPAQEETLWLSHLT